jgi:hypothetical protein
MHRKLRKKTAVLVHHRKNYGFANAVQLLSLALVFRTKLNVL